MSSSIEVSSGSEDIDRRKEARPGLVKPVEGAMIVKIVL